MCHLRKKWLLFEIKQMLLFVGRFSSGSLLLGDNAALLELFNHIYGRLRGSSMSLLPSSLFVIAILTLTSVLREEPLEEISPK